MFEKTEAMKVYIILVLLEFGKPNAIHNYHLGMLLIPSDYPFGLAHASLQGIPEMGDLAELSSLFGCPMIVPFQELPSFKLDVENPPVVSIRRSLSERESRGFSTSKS
jgi:hypothetical protein